MANEKEPKRSQVFECKICDYITYKIGNWNRHISTHKHKRLIMANKTSQKNEQHNESEFMCENCGKMYKHSSSLCKHKKKCFVFTENNELSTKNITIGENTHINEIMDISEKEDTMSKSNVQEVENKVARVNDVSGIHPQIMKKQ